jgi:hypothetical protein
LFDYLGPDAGFVETLARIVFLIRANWQTLNEIDD